MFEFSIGAEKVVFTGDLGNSPTPLLKDTEPVTDATYMVMEVCMVIGIMSRKMSEIIDLRKLFVKLWREGDISYPRIFSNVHR